MHNPYEKYLKAEDDPLEILERTPARMQELAGGLTSTQAGQASGPGKWSIAQIMSHIADNEMVFAARLRWIILESGKTLVGYDQDAWMKNWERNPEPLSESLDRFRVLRRFNVRLFRTATPQDLERTAMHQETGAESAGIYLRRLAGHDRNHIEQLERLLAASG